jgi:hypothetical protein
VITDLQTRLDQLAGPAAPPSLATVAADLVRGRRALRRRRIGQIASGSGLLAVAALGAALAIPGGAPTRAPAPPVVADGGNATLSTQEPAKLVAYKGAQPAGFTIDEVPEGWEVQGVDKYGLTLAPKDTADKDPHSFQGKIAIQLQRSVPDVPKKQVVVNGTPALLATMQGEATPGTLFVKQPSGAYLVIQVWHTLNWGEKEIVRFAGGVHVGKDAGLSVG